MRLNVPRRSTMTRSHWVATWIDDAASTAMKNPKHSVQMSTPPTKRAARAVVVTKETAKTKAENTVPVLSSTWRVRGELMDSISE